MIRRLTLYILVLSSVIFSSCNKKTPADHIVNKWRVTDVSDGPLAASLKKATFEFKKDGTWSLTGTPAPDQSGMYTLSEDYKILTTTDVRGESSSAEIIELSKEQLIFIDKKTGIKFTTVPK